MGRKKSNGNGSGQITLGITYKKKSGETVDISVKCDLSKVVGGDNAKRAFAKWYVNQLGGDFLGCDVIAT
jgi:hypothetical protein